jgi:hypothetical protein
MGIQPHLSLFVHSRDPPYSAFARYRHMDVLWLCCQIPPFGALPLFPTTRRRDRSPPKHSAMHLTRVWIIGKFDSPSSSADLGGSATHYRGAGIGADGCGGRNLGGKAPRALMAGPGRRNLHTHIHRICSQRKMTLSTTMSFIAATSLCCSPRSSALYCNSPLFITCLP